MAIRKINSRSIEDGAVSSADFSGTVSSLSSSGNLTFNTTGQRINGEFSNATVNSRTIFNTTTTNGTTGIYAIPNGTATAASWQATNNSDATNASKILIATNGTTDVQLVSGRNGTGTYLPLSFYTNGSQQAQLNTTGNLGLGVTPSTGSGWSSNLELLSTSNIVNQGTDFSVGSNWYYDAAYKYKTTGASSNIYLKDGSIRFQYSGSGTAGNPFTFSESMRITNSGYVGIGNNSPSNPLVVSGGSNTLTGIVLQTTAGGGNNWGFRPGYPAVSNATFTLMNETAGTVALAVDVGNNLGVGTSPAKRLHVYKTGDGQTPVRFETSNASGNILDFYNDSNGWTLDSYGDLRLVTGRTGSGSPERLSISSTGRIGIATAPATGNTLKVFNLSGDNAVQFGNPSTGVYLPNGGSSWSAYSDLRLKTVTGTYDSPLEDIEKIDVIKFTWNYDTENKPQVGVSAQSVQLAVPEAIHQNTLPDDSEDKTEYLTVKYTELIPLMIASIQKLKAENDALKARLDAAGL